MSELITVNRKDFEEFSVDALKYRLMHSMVKTVGKEGLAHDTEVLAIDKFGELLLGHLFGDSCYSDLLENAEIGVDVCGGYVEQDNASLDNVTKYIEQKDLLELFK